MAPIKQLTAKAWVLTLILVLLATVATELIYRGGWGQGAEYVYSDAWHRLAGKRYEPKQVGLVMIDEVALAAHREDPLVFWTPHFARAIATLRAVGVKWIAIDFLFSGSPESWLGKLNLSGEASRNFDKSFREELNRGGVLLAGFRVGDGNQVDDFILPSPDYLLALPDMDLASHIGLANLRSDPDGAIRRFGTVEADIGVANAEGLPAIAFGTLAAVRFTGQENSNDAWRFGQHDLGVDDDLVISYAGPPGTIKAISFERLVGEGAREDPGVQALAGKLVIIGAGYGGMNDNHSTPYSTSIAGAQQLMAGPEIQANIVETLLGGHYIAHLPGHWRIVAFLSAFALLGFLGARLSIWWAAGLMAVIAVLIAGLGYVLFLKDWLMPVAHLQIGLMMVMAGLTLSRLTKEERERARIRRFFGRYASDQVINSLMASSEMPELGGKAYVVTVLFSDIRNFTTLSERLSAKEVVEFLNAYFERACAVMLKEGGTIDKFIGDAIMVEFGAPLSQDDHALRAIRAAVALRGVATEFRQWMATRFAGRDLPEFDIGIGIHSGEAIIGNIGSSSRMEYTAIGDTVNLASRLEGKTKETNCIILASSDTVMSASASGAEIQTGECHELLVKGRSQPVLAWNILGVNGSNEPSRH